MSDTPATDEDDLGLTFPDKPSELRRMSDDALFVTYRKMAYGGRYPFDRMVEQELAMRLIRSLKEFKAAADRSARMLNVLTVVLVVLTAVLVVYVIRGR